MLFPSKEDLPNAVTPPLGNPRETNNKNYVQAYVQECLFQLRPAEFPNFSTRLVSVALVQGQ